MERLWWQLNKLLHSFPNVEFEVCVCVFPLSVCVCVVSCKVYYRCGWFVWAVVRKGRSKKEGEEREKDNFADKI